jgi:3-oxoacyl-[acyl-carrier-protein] synthase-3
MRPSTLYRSKIIGTGMYVPDAVLTNRHLESMMDTTEAWIDQRTGIGQRHISAPDQTVDMLASEAAKNALADAGVAAESIDGIIVGTCTQKAPFPSAACEVHYSIKGKPGIGGTDVSAACSGFLFALEVADMYIQLGKWKTALLIGADVMTKNMDFKDRGTSILFGDGAGAVVLKATEEQTGVLDVRTHIDSTNKELLKYNSNEVLRRVPLWANYDTEKARALGKSAEQMLDEMMGNGVNPDQGKPCVMLSARCSSNTEQEARDIPYVKGLPYITMRGREVYVWAKNTLSNSVMELLERNGIPKDARIVLVPHQANERIIEAAKEFLEEKSKFSNLDVYVNIRNYGNTSAAAVPIALHEAARQKRIRQKDKVVLVAFGAGLTWGEALIEW